MTPARPSGEKWRKFRTSLYTMWGWPLVCYFCRHPIAWPPARCSEVEHVYSVVTHPHLMWDPLYWRPVHGGDHTRRGGMNKRCPDCDLACNQTSANAPDAPRAPDGMNLPFTETFIAAVTERRAAGQKLRSAGHTPAPPRRPRPRRVQPSPGRPW